jgi:hypothetical protein
MSARQTADRFIKAQKEAGVKRRDIAIALFKKGFTEAQVGTIMGIHAKTAHAMKVDNSKAGMAKWTEGKRVQIDPKTSHVKGGGLAFNAFIKASHEIVKA